ncbi:hypothetical protein SLS56_008815 [Neofusicoccum ribis]|uniref:Uncharacterized protein n=1 Tax=Neofusicoccum ribis TaxID=45134 RepID=A0ABR3SJ16_9PEZI
MYNNAFNYKSMYDAEDDELGSDIDELVHVEALPRYLQDEFYEQNYSKAQLDNRSRDRVMQEFLEINEIIQTSNHYSGVAYSEAAWNGAMYRKVLHVALRSIDGIE